ncbi:hypothetical protein JL2886_00303 [Phaeobacter gallaeciensis]|uniref:Uncharacterized protein n=1 Tax=Phaeobacter gallaeciensis TaxID=60890 RepID=A0A1B0ZM40_9RHOB|nr:hypothetical protein JL2886_00303 [Phaeobacter gallaeciensis]
MIDDGRERPSHPPDKSVAMARATGQERGAARNPTEAR